MNKKRSKIQKENESTRVNFTNKDSRHVIAMEPDGHNVQRHFKRHQDCPEANTFLNHITTYRNHFTGEPSDPMQHEELREQIRSQFVTAEKQKELAQKSMMTQGRGCSWSDEMKEFVEGKSRDAPLFSCACCGLRDMDMFDDSIKRTYEYMWVKDLGHLKVEGNELQEHIKRLYSKNEEEK